MTIELLKYAEDVWEQFITEPPPFPSMLPKLPRFEALNISAPRREAGVPRCCPDAEPACEYTITSYFKPITVSAEELRSTLDLMWRLTGRP